MKVVSFLNIFASQVGDWTFQEGPGEWPIRMNMQIGSNNVVEN